MQTMFDYLCQHIIQLGTGENVGEGPALTIFKLQNQAIQDSFGEMLGKVLFDSEQGRDAKIIIDAGFVMLSAIDQLLNGTLEPEITEAYAKMQMQIISSCVQELLS